MKKGDQAEGVVTRVDFPNKGIVLTEDGQQITVKNVIEGQRVLCVIRKNRNGRAEGRLSEVLAPAPQELKEPYCPHFGECGGCAYQNLPYEAQLSCKEAQVGRLLRKVLGDDVFARTYEGIRKSPSQFAYRNKMEFTFGDACKDGPLTLGLHKRGSFYDIVPVTECRIISEDMRKILAETQAYFRSAGTSYYHRLRHEGYLRNLLVRRAQKTGEILIDLVTSSDMEPEKERELLDGWRERMLALETEGRIVGILHTRNDRPADVIEDQGTEKLYGKEYFYEELLGLRFRISPFSFFQTNSRGAEELYGTAREFLSSAMQKDGAPLRTVYDLYSGTGTIAQILANAAERVIGVELVEEAVEAARENAKENGLSNCEFLCGDVLKVMDDIPRLPDCIILDPPRDGIHPKALQKILGYGVDTLLYISCKPTSLARDLEVFLAHGYKVRRLCCVDMFPGTVHVETVVMLSHKKPDSVINVKVEFGEGEGKVPLDNIAKRAEAYKPKERVTYKMIKEYIEAKYGFKVHTAYIAEVKRDLGLPMYDAPNAVEELKQPRKHPTPEKVEAIKDALKHFEVI